MAGMLVEMLRRHGIYGQACTSGLEALALLAQRQFDLVISDLNMPGIDGMQLLREVRLQFPFVAFVMVTGSDNISLGIQAMKEGAKDYLLKPFHLDTVVASIRRALEMKRLE